MSVTRARWTCRRGSRRRATSATWPTPSMTRTNSAGNARPHCYSSGCSMPVSVGGIQIRCRRLLKPSSVRRGRDYDPRNSACRFAASKTFVTVSPGRRKRSDPSSATERSMSYRPPRGAAENHRGPWAHAFWCSTKPDMAANVVIRKINVTDLREIAVPHGPQERWHQPKLIRFQSLY